MTTALAHKRTTESDEGRFGALAPARRAALKAVAAQAAANETIEKAAQTSAQRPVLDTPGFKVVRDDCVTSADGGVRWGWKQWIAIAPDVRKHLDKYGPRTGFAGAIVKAQRKHLPKEQHRTLGSLSVACSPSAAFDIAACVRYITEHPDPLSLIGTAPVLAPRKRYDSSRLTDEQLEERRALHAKNIEGPASESHEERRKRLQREHKRLSRAKAKAKLEAKAQAAQSYSAKAQDARDLRAAELDAQFSAQIALDKQRESERWNEGRVGPLNTPEQRAASKERRARASAQPVATPQTQHNDALSGFLATPIGVFVPALKAFMQSTLSELLKPHHALIAETVRAAVIDVVGAPAPSSAAQETTQETTQTSEHAALDFELDRAEQRETSAETTDETSQAKSEQVGQLEETSAEIAAREALASAPHDLESQLKLAAKALGVCTGAKRESIIVVGLQPKTEHEVEKFYGRAFRFTFKRKHEFVETAHLPPSTDGVILCKTRLTHELTGVTRRYAIPVQHAANTSSAVLWALKQLFPESAETFSQVRH